MVDYLLGRKYPGRQYADAFGKEKTSDDTIINHLDPGDLIAYWNVEKKLYSHLTMYLGNGKIACHTYCRSDDPACTWDKNWDLGRGRYLWTPLHIFV
jgi:cell wall-associated NlpC family hydrolase